MPKLTDTAPKAAPSKKAADTAEEAPKSKEGNGAAKKAAPKKVAATKKAAAARPSEAAMQAASTEAPKRARLLDQGQPLSEKRDLLNYLITGEHGTGKSTVAAAAAKLGRVLVINAEGGIKKAPLERLGIPTDNIVVLPEKPEHLTFDWLETLFWELRADLEKDPDAWVAVVWDSITEIHIAMLQNIVDHQNAKAERLGRSRTKENQAGDLIDRFFTDLSDYGVMTEQMRQLLRKYRDLPCHFVVTALQRRDTDDDGRVAYRPAVTPALAKDLQAFVDVIGVTEVLESPEGDEIYTALFRPVGKWRGKDRFGVVPKRLVDPTFDRVLAYVHEDLTVDSDERMIAARESMSPKADAAAVASSDQQA